MSIQYAVEAHIWAVIGSLFVQWQGSFDKRPKRSPGSEHFEPRVATTFVSSTHPGSRFPTLLFEVAKNSFFRYSIVETARLSLEPSKDSSVAITQALAHPSSSRAQGNSSPDLSAIIVNHLGQNLEPAGTPIYPNLSPHSSPNRC